MSTPLCCSSQSNVQCRLLRLWTCLCRKRCPQLAAGIASFWIWSPLCSTTGGLTPLLPVRISPSSHPLAPPASNWRRARLPLQCGWQPLSLHCLQLKTCTTARVVGLDTTSDFIPCCLQLEVCREQAQWAQAEKRTFLRQRIDSRLANLYLETRDYQAAIALITKLLSEVRPDLLGEMLTVAPCSTLGADKKDAPPGPHLHRSARKDADRGISSVGTALLGHTAAY